jgi:Rho guanine nucleotide exchange factor 12
VTYSIRSRTSSIDLTTSPESLNQQTSTDDDSDLEADVNSLPNLSDFIPTDVLQELYQSREWKLQTTINELVHTERTHLKGLKIMQKCFREPMEHFPGMSPVEIDCIFRNLDHLIDLHSKF